MQKINTSVGVRIRALETEKNEIINDYGKEVKSWKKELENANKNHLNLKKKLEILTVDRNSASHIDLDDSSPSNFAFSVSAPSNFIQPNLAKCNICAADITDYLPEYFCGEAISPACNRCKKEANLEDYEMTPDPFESFLHAEMPFSMVSYWTPANTSYYSKQTFLNIPSFVPHYVLASNSGDSSISIDNLFMVL